MSLYPPPAVLDAQVWTSLPDRFRNKDQAPDWAVANKWGASVDSFLEGPSFDRDGNLWLTDIPYGRIFRISPDREWTLVADYDGWPNGLKIHRDGRIFVADYKHGIVEINAGTGAVTDVVSQYNSEHFRGCNDLFLDSHGRLYFTDQGQSGMHMPNGRVYRYDLETEKLTLLIDTGQSPNGLVMNKEETMLYVAMTRGNSVWRLPLMPNGSVTKVGVFLQLSGGHAGPDGLALDADGGLWIAHAGNASIWGFSKLGEPLYRIVGAEGLMTTNLSFDASGDKTLYFVDSDKGAIMRATVPVHGHPLFSHAET